MIHQYKNNGYNIVLDVNSGSVHVVDDMVYDIIGLYENNTLEQITDALRDRYSVQDIKEAYESVGCATTGSTEICSNPSSAR